VYIDSGSNHELVGEAGFGFRQKEEIPQLLENLVEEYVERQKRIQLSSIADVTKEYLKVLEPQ